MPTAASSTDAIARSVADVGHLVRFRATRSGGRSAPPRLGGCSLTLTLAALVVPMLLPGPLGSQRAFDVLLLLPTAMAGVLVLATVAAVTTGGGRELLPREQAVAYPVSPTTDHLGALLLAPLNIAWLLQAWVLVGCTSYALGWRVSPRRPAGHRCCGWSWRPRPRRPPPGPSRGYAARSTGSRSCAAPASPCSPALRRCSSPTAGEPSWTGCRRSG